MLWLEITNKAAQCLEIHAIRQREEIKRKIYYQMKNTN